VLAISGDLGIGNLGAVIKVNGFPFGLGNGNWAGEIKSFVYANNPPDMAVSTADGITIIDHNGVTHN
jgi:hypothetical protein